MKFYRIRFLSVKLNYNKSEHRSVDYPQVKLGSPEIDEESRLTRHPLIIFNIDMEETSDVSKFYVYILFSYKDSKLYIGFTNNLKRRLVEHANGMVEATKSRIPVKLIHYEFFIDRKDAEAREKFLKSGYGRKQFKEILKNTFKNLE